MLLFWDLHRRAQHLSPVCFITVWWRRLAWKHLKDHNQSWEWGGGTQGSKQLQGELWYKTAPCTISGAFENPRMCNCFLRFEFVLWLSKRGSVLTEGVEVCTGCLHDWREQGGAKLNFNLIHFGTIHKCFHGRCMFCIFDREEKKKTGDAHQANMLV